MVHLFLHIIHGLVITQTIVDYYRRMIIIFKKNSLDIYIGNIRKSILPTIMKAFIYLGIWFLLLKTFGRHILNRRSFSRIIFLELNHINCLNALPQE